MVAMGGKRLFGGSVFFLPVVLSGVRTGVRWADGPEEVDETDWTQLVPPLEVPWEVLGHLVEGDEGVAGAFLPSPFLPPELLPYPRLVRDPLLWVENPPWERGSRPAPLRAIRALEGVYRALQRDPDPCSKGSRTRQAIQQAAQEVGLLTSFRRPDWSPFGMGLDGLAFVRQFYDDSLSSWVGAACFLHYLGQALDLFISGLTAEEVKEELEAQRASGKCSALQGGPVDQKCAFLWRKGDEGFRAAMERFSLIASSGFREYRKSLRNRFAQVALIEDPYSHEEHGSYAGESHQALLLPTNGQVWNQGAEEAFEARSAAGQPFSKNLYRAYLSILDLALLGMTSTRIKTCLNCGELLVGKREDARFCSDKCRVYFHRKRKGLGHQDHLDFLPAWDMGDNEGDA